MAEYAELTPNVADIEAAFLGAMLVDPFEVKAYADILKANDFFIVRNGFVWEALVALVRRGDSVDLNIVIEELRRQGRLEEVGGLAYLTELMLRGGLSIYAETYVRLIQHAAFRRKVLLMADDLAKVALRSDMTTEDILARVDALTNRLHVVAPADDGYYAGSQAQDDYEQIIAARIAEEAPENFLVHITALEKYVPAIRPGKLVVVSGLSGHGKTILMEEWAEWLALLGHRVLYVTTELLVVDHLDRRYVRHSGLSYASIIQPTEQEEGIIRNLRSQLEQWQHNLDFWKTSTLGHEAVIAQMKQAHEHGARAFFIDYFWEILADDQRGTIDSAVKALHEFAASTRSLVVVGSQLTETEHGLRTYGTRRLEQKAALHLQLGTAKRLKVPAQYSVDGRVIEVDVDEPDRFRDLVIVKNTFGPAHVSVRLFLEGERFRFIEEDNVGYGVPKAALSKSSDTTAHSAEAGDKQKTNSAGEAAD